MLFLKLFFKNLGKNAIYFLVGLAVIGALLGLLALILYSPIIGMLVGGVVIFLTMVIKNTYDEWKTETIKKIKKQIDEYEEKMLNCIHRWEKADNSIDANYWYSEKMRYQRLIDKEEVKIKKLIKAIEK